MAVHTIEGDCLGLLDRWAGADTALVIDAARSIHAPGSIAELDAGSTPLPSGLSLRSSHAFGVADAVELARALGVLPPAVVIYAIEGRSFGYGDGLTRAVAAAAEEVTRRIRERVETSGAARRPRASFPATQRTRDARSTSRLE